MNASISIDLVQDKILKLIILKYLSLYLCFSVCGHPYRCSSFHASSCFIFWFSISTSSHILMVRKIQYVSNLFFWLNYWLTNGTFLSLYDLCFTRLLISGFLCHSSIHAAPDFIFLEPFWGKLMSCFCISHSLSNACFYILMSFYVHVFLKQSVITIS